MTSYVDHVEQVAHDAVFRSGRLWTEIKAAWQTLEGLAQAVGYDVLEHASREKHGLIRRCVRELLELLYRVPGALTPQRDAADLIKKDQEYGGSWCRRGGPGAFMMLARKWDRIALQVEKRGGGELHAVLFIDTRAEGIQDDLGDLRRYLILVEAWCRHRMEELDLAAVDAAVHERTYEKSAEREEDIPF